jgi:DUF1680 family protein
MRNYQGIKERQVDPVRNNPTAAGQTRSATWSILALCSLNDLTADKKYLDDAMVLFNNEVVPKWKKVGPYLDTAALQYYYSTQPLVELAEHTGDANVLALLKEGCEKNFAKAGLTEMYAEWPIFLSNIYAYVGYKTGNEGYIKKAEELFCTYVPAAPSPFCYRPSSQAWDKESGKMIRNGHILQFVEWKLKQAAKGTLPGL